MNLWFAIVHAYTDLTELDLPSTMKITHPDASKKLDFELVLTPDEGVSAIILALTLAFHVGQLLMLAFFT